MGTLRKEPLVEPHVGNSNPIYSRLWCFQLLHMALKFGEVAWKINTGWFLRRA